jgi:hypothetical protein
VDPTMMTVLVQYSSAGATSNSYLVRVPGTVPVLTRSVSMCRNSVFALSNKNFFQLPIVVCDVSYFVKYGVHRICRNLVKGRCTIESGILLI